MRSATTHRGRETLCPAVPRVWHHGAHGANVSPQLQATYFDPIALALSPDLVARWSAASGRADLAAAVRGPYEARLEALLSGAKHRGVGFESANSLAAALDDSRLDGTAVVLCYSLPDVAGDPQGEKTVLDAFKPIATYLRIWHEPKRMSHHGLHELWGPPVKGGGAGGATAGRGRLLLIDARSQRYGHFIPSGTQPINAALNWPASHPPPLYALRNPGSSPPRLAVLSEALGLGATAATAGEAP